MLERGHSGPPVLEESLMPHTHVITAAALLLCLGTGLAQAQYRGMSCDQLYFERNSIYKNAGYCFRTPRAIQTFGNGGCQFDNQNDVPLSGSSRAAVAAIVAQESALGCPR